MKNLLSGGLVAVMISVTAYSAGYAVNAVEASVKAIDATAKTITVKALDGTEHTFRIVGRTAIHGAEATPALAKDSLKDLKEGSDVVVHYSKRGTEETAEEIDRIGEGGLKESKGTLTKLDRSGKKVVMKGDDGVEQTYELSDHASRDAGKDIAEGSEKGAKVTVYYTEKGGRKIAHFFKTAV
jgi:VCBS repeat-containing protein